MRQAKTTLRANNDYSRCTVNVTLFFYCLGYSGTKCEIYGATTPVPLKCNDCNSIGTQYCASVNGLFQCNCKSGEGITKEW